LGEGEGTLQNFLPRDDNIVHCPAEFEDSMEKHEKSFSITDLDTPDQENTKSCQQYLENAIKSGPRKEEINEEDDTISNFSQDTHNNNNNNSSMLGQNEPCPDDKAHSVRSYGSSIFGTNASVISQPSRHLIYQQKKK